MQHAYRRSLAVILILGSFDDEKGPQLFKVDPAGHFLSFKATAAGEPLAARVRLSVALPAHLFNQCDAPPFLFRFNPNTTTSSRILAPVSTRPPRAPQAPRRPTQ